MRENRPSAPQQIQRLKRRTNEESISVLNLPHPSQKLSPLSNDQRSPRSRKADKWVWPAFRSTSWYRKHQGMIRGAFLRHRKLLLQILRSLRVSSGNLICRLTMVIPSSRTRETGPESGANRLRSLTTQLLTEIGGHIAASYFTRRPAVQIDFLRTRARLIEDLAEGA